MWILEIVKKFLLREGGAIKIAPDHLPGLRPPKPRPKLPPRPSVQSVRPSNIDAIYRAFKTRGGYKPKKQNRNDPRF